MHGVIHRSIFHLNVLKIDLPLKLYLQKMSTRETNFLQGIRKVLNAQKNTKLFLK